jgi:hypothetical protein
MKRLLNIHDEIDENDVEFIKDEIEDIEDEFNAVDLADEIEEPIKISIDTLLYKIKNDLKFSEFARKPFIFRIEGRKKPITGIPMALMNKNETVIFKIDTKLEKFNIKDMII